MTSRREFTKIISIGTIGTSTLGASSCSNNKKKQDEPVIWPSDKVNLAFVGLNHRGLKNLDALKDQNIVALCDVDWGEQYQTQKIFEAFPKASCYKDFRIMLEKEKNIEGVVISTPDHTHGVIAMMSIKMGKHVYCEKPLAHSVYETREITKAAKKYDVYTQMGNQGHSSNAIREFYEHIKAGTIGKVTEVHAWCNRPAGGGTVNAFPHGITMPEGKFKVPKRFDWDLWLGPAPYRPYHPIYHPRRWRGFKDFGCGALGDFGCHILDPAFWALELGSPESVIASTTNLILEKNYNTFPTASIITYEFPERNNQPPVKLIWYDGGLLPLYDDRFKDIEYNSNGALLVGEKGIISHGSHGAAGFKILPFDKNAELITPPHLLERSKGHHVDWIEAIKTGKPSSANFDYSGPLTETVLLGVVASTYRNHILRWDNNNMKFSNFDDPENLIQPNFREGWYL